MESATNPPFDVAIVGGGPAGLAAALILGRMRRRVLLLDDDDPAHGVSEGVHGLFGHDGTPPFELRRTAREQLRPYESVIVRTVTVEEARTTPSGFSVTVGETTSEAGVLLLATGVRYELPPIEGGAQIWARGVYHCPYCHGWEVRDRPLAAYGAGAAHLALLLTSLSDDIVLLTDGSSDLNPDEAEHLQQAGVVVRDDPVARLEAEGGRLARVAFVDGSTDDRDGLFLCRASRRASFPGSSVANSTNRARRSSTRMAARVFPASFPRATRRPTRKRSCSPPQLGPVPPTRSTRALPAGCFRSPTEARPRRK